MDHLLLDKKSHHQRVKQKRQQVSEMGAISRAEKEKSPENDQSPQRRWDQVCKNKISTTDRKS